MPKEFFGSSSRTCGVLRNTGTTSEQTRGGNSRAKCSRVQKANMAADGWERAANCLHSPSNRRSSRMRAQCREIEALIRAIGPIGSHSSMTHSGAPARMNSSHVQPPHRHRPISGLRRHRRAPNAATAHWQRGTSEASRPFPSQHRTFGQ